MDNRQIHYFTEVVKQGGFSKAAEHLYVSQPTISNVVKDLEKELDAVIDADNQEIGINGYRKITV